MSHSVIPIGDDPRPYLMDEAVLCLEHILDGYDGKANVFEWGAGHSTIWLAQRAEFVASVEHRAEWRDEVLLGARKHNVQVRLVLAREARYADVICDYPAGMFDVMIVDGHQPWRAACINTALEHITDGSWLVVDDSQWESYRRRLDRLAQRERWDCLVFEGEKLRRGKLKPTETRFFQKRGT